MEGLVLAEHQRLRRHSRSESGPLRIAVLAQQPFDGHRHAVVVAVRRGHEVAQPGETMGLTPPVQPAATRLKARAGIDFAPLLSRLEQL